MGKSLRSVLLWGGGGVRAEYLCYITCVCVCSKISIYQHLETRFTICRKLREIKWLVYIYVAHDAKTYVFLPIRGSFDFNLCQIWVTYERNTLLYVFLNIFLKSVYKMQYFLWLAKRVMFMHTLSAFKPWYVNELNLTQILLLTLTISLFFVISPALDVIAVMDVMTVRSKKLWLATRNN